MKKTKTEELIESACLYPTDTVEGALNLLATNDPRKTHIPAGIVLVINKQNKLLGIATDGDLRRALSNGISVSEPLSRVMNTNMFFIEGPRESGEILRLAIEKIREEGWHRDRLNKILIVDKERRIVDLVSFYDLLQANDMRFKRIGIVGLGYVGLTLGLTLAGLGFKVFGCDTNESIAAALKKGESPFFEDGIEEKLDDHYGKDFFYVSDFQGKNNCEVYFIAVGTPLDGRGRPILSYLKQASSDLGKVLKKNDTVILRSTVPLGTTRGVVVPILEKVSGLTAGEDFFVVFAPERTIEGQALKELRTLPQVIGGLNRASSNVAANIFNLMTDSVFIVDSLEEAEVVKLINNTYRDVTFAFSNEVALVCKQWNIDTNKVINAANMGYARSNVPKPSPGVGGYCLEKDPLIFYESAQRKGYDPLLFKHARTVSDTMVRSVAERITNFLKNNARGDMSRHKIFVIGFAFKGNPPTSDMRGSTTVHLIKYLQKKKCKNIHGYDPLVGDDAIRSLGVNISGNLKNGFKDARAIIIMNDHPEFKTIDVRRLLGDARKDVLLFDTWALYNKDDISRMAHVVYERL